MSTGLPHFAPPPPEDWRAGTVGALRHPSLHVPVGTVCHNPVSSICVWTEMSLN
jgi:hypothetical protein